MPYHRKFRFSFYFWNLLLILDRRNQTPRNNFKTDPASPKYKKNQIFWKCLKPLKNASVKAPAHQKCNFSAAGAKEKHHITWCEALSSISASQSALRAEIRLSTFRMALDIFLNFYGVYLHIKLYAVSQKVPFYFLLPESASRFESQKQNPQK